MDMTFRPLVAALLSMVSGLASAATVTVDVRGADGRPLRDAVVSVDTGGPAAVPHGPYLMEQRDIAFQPHVLIVPVGASVGFPNRDQVRHHVYSFSKAKTLNLKLYGKEEARSVGFDKPGVVALGCNIHDQMSGFVYVTATPYAAVSDAAGHVAITGVPAGGATLRIWHPSIRAGDNMLAQAVTIAPAGYATMVTIRR